MNKPIEDVEEVHLRLAKPEFESTFTFVGRAIGEVPNCFVPDSDFPDQSMAC